MYGESPGVDMASPAQSRQGAIVVTVMTGTLALVPVLAGVGVLLALPVGQVLLLALLVPLGLSAAAAAVVVGLLATRRLPDGRAARRDDAAEGLLLPQQDRPSPRRQEAQARVDLQESRLLRAVEVGADEIELMRQAVALHEARLHLARVLLAEDGDLPQLLQDELVVAHRGTAAWLRAQTS